MKRDELLKKIALKARRDKRNRLDPRYLQVMGFLVAKGFLRTNQAIPRLPYWKIRLADAIWAGKNVEPRILEVLPAAVLRLANRFDLDPAEHPELYAAVENLMQKKPGGEFLGVPYEKYKVWAHLRLRDGRMKDVDEKKITKTFRLSPRLVAVLKEQSKLLACTETEVIEKALLKCR